MATLDRLRLVGARLRMPMALLGLMVIGVDALSDIGAFVLAGIGLLFGGIALLFLLPSPHRAVRPLRSPVLGRWLAVNSPATKVPSHGTHAYGQTFAVDLLYDPDSLGGPTTRWWPLARPAPQFPSFGQPIVAPADGVVVRRTDWQRDHWSRTSWPSLAWFFVEGMLRELTGPGRVLGNHIVLRLDDGIHVVLAHLARRSVTVDRGDRVVAGQLVARCGNSGNTTEPHLHLHLSDHSRPLVAAGVPMALVEVELEGNPDAGIPADGMHLVATPA